MKLFDLGIIAIIATIFLSGVTGAVIENEKDILPNEVSNKEGE